MTNASNISHMLDDAAQSSQRYHRMSLISNEKDFVAVCNAYSSLTRRNKRYYRADDIVADKQVGFYFFELTLTLLQETKLTLPELKRCMDIILENTDDKTKWRLSNLFPTLMKWCRLPDFEPEWHMKKRGDKRPLPTNKDKNLWKHLKRLYTDPEYSRVREPDFVQKAGQMYPGYIQCCNRAKQQGHDELRRIYGNNVDLTPLVDKRKESEQSIVDFVHLLSSDNENGSFLPL